MSKPDSGTDSSSSVGAHWRISYPRSQREHQIFVSREMVRESTWHSQVPSMDLDRCDYPGQDAEYPLIKYKGRKGKGVLRGERVMTQC